jgi:uncharacterized protein
MHHRTRISLAVTVAIATMSAGVQAAPTEFDNFTPLANSTSPPIPVSQEPTPITFGSANFSQVSIADRTAQLAAGQANSGSWDMITTNTTGPDQGRYLFTVFETGSSGVQRTDLLNGNATTTIWQSPGVAPALNSHVAFDASYWTPWGTYITAEESWTTAAGGASTSPYGRLFELNNPLTATNNSNASFLHRNVIPRTSHEGIQFDSANNMYFIDELNGGSVYKYSSVAGAGSNHFDAGKTSVLRVGTGTTANATGGYSWVDITDANGVGLAGSLTITDPNGVVSVDGRNTTELAAFKGTDYQRPEDIQVATLANGDEVIFMATTTTNEVYMLNLDTNNISLYANTSSLNLATGAAVGSGLTSPDNLAIDSEGNIYIVEDRNGGVDDDIWFAKDINKDGDLLDAGEGLARWASNGTAGSEFTGLYFDPYNPNRAWVNIQHPTSGVDRMIQITAAVPEPSEYAMMLAGLAIVGGIARRRASRVASA